MTIRIKIREFFIVFFEIRSYVFYQVIDIILLNYSVRKSDIDLGLTQVMIFKLNDRGT
jgi:hypothetical protein